MSVLPLPVYATSIPEPVRIAYALRRGESEGSAELAWQHDGSRYEARLDGTIGSSRLEWASIGELDAAGIAPLRYTSRRKARTLQAVNFQRGSGRITFSGPGVEHPLAPGAQDRLTWIVQLAAIARVRTLRPGDRLSMQVAGVGGEADVWTFLVDFEPPSAEGGPALLRIVREALRPWDLRAEVWIDPSRGHWPVRALLSYADDARGALEFERID